jgi:hypothetical protein
MIAYWIYCQLHYLLAQESLLEPKAHPGKDFQNLLLFERQ